MIMVTTLKGTNIAPTEEIKKYLDAKLETLEKFVDPADPTHRLDVELAKTTDRHQSGKIFKAEATLSFLGKVFRAVAMAETLHGAIDALEDQLSMELGKAKRKERGVIRRTGARVKELMQDGRNWRF